MKKRIAVGTISLVVVLIVASLSLAAVSAQTPPLTPTSSAGTFQRTVTTMGQGEVRVTPDMAVIQLGVQIDAQVASDAFEQVNTRVQEVIQSLRDAGIPEEDIQTQVVQLSPRIEPPTEPVTSTVTVKGFTASNIVEVRVGELAAMGDVVTAAVSAGANTIQNIRFDVTDPGEVRADALREAFDDARTQAEALADLAGAQLGEVLMMNTQGVVPMPFAVPMMAAEVGQRTAILPGQQSVTANVQVTWALEPGTGVGAPTLRETVTPEATETPVPAATQMGTGTTTSTPPATSAPAATVTPQAATSTPGAGGAGGTATSTPSATGQGTATPVTGAGEVPPEAVVLAQSMLARQLGATSDQVRIVSFEQVEFRNACLGLPTPGEVCAEVITSGYLITFEVNGRQYQARTDLDGQQIRFTSSI